MSIWISEINSLHYQVTQRTASTNHAVAPVVLSDMMLGWLSLITHEFMF